MQLANHRQKTKRMFMSELRMLQQSLKVSQSCKQAGLLVLRDNIRKEVMSNIHSALVFLPASALLTLYVLNHYPVLFERFGCAANFKL